MASNINEIKVNCIVYVGILMVKKTGNAARCTPPPPLPQSAGKLLSITPLLILLPPVTGLAEKVGVCGRL